MFYFIYQVFQVCYNSFMNKLISNNWTKAITINLIILIAVFYISDLVYETNDDFAISSRIAAGYPYVGFINYFFCKVLVPVQKVFTSVNVFVVSQITFSFVGFVLILKLLLDSNKNKAIIVLSTFVITLFSFDHYAAIQFTKTAALLLTAGMLTIVDSMVNKRTLIYYIYGVLLLYVGVSYRPDGLICVIGYAGLFLMAWVLANRKIIIPEGYLKPKRIMLYLTLLILIGLSWCYYGVSERINESGELKGYSDYSELRSDVVDYPVYNRYDENKEQYNEIGISENDLYLIDRWYLDYDGAASAENLSKILEIDNKSTKAPYTMEMALKQFLSDVREEIRELSFTGVHILLLVILAAVMCILLKPKHWIFIAAVGIYTLCIYLAVYHMHRPVYRALYVADLGASIWLLYYLNNNIEPVRRMKARSTFVIAAVILTILLCYPIQQGCVQKHNHMQTKIMPKQLSNYIEMHEDSLFVFSASEKKFLTEFTEPLKSPGIDCEKNVIGAGSWGTLSPYVLDKMLKYDVSNPISGLIDNDNAYYVGNSNIDNLNEYYNKWYGNEHKTIKLIKISSVEGMTIWKVVSTDM